MLLKEIIALLFFLKLHLYFIFHRNETITHKNHEHQDTIASHFMFVYIRVFSNVLVCALFNLLNYFVQTFRNFVSIFLSSYLNLLFFFAILEYINDYFYFILFDLAEEKHAFVRI